MRPFRLAPLTLALALFPAVWAQPVPEPGTDPDGSRGFQVGRPVAPDDLSFLKGLPGFQSHQQLQEVQHFHYKLGDSGLMPWINSMRTRGFRLQATPELLVAQRGDICLVGSVKGSQFDLKAGPNRAFQEEASHRWGGFPWVSQP